MPKVNHQGLTNSHDHALMESWPVTSKSQATYAKPLMDHMVVISAMQRTKNSRILYTLKRLSFNNYLLVVRQSAANGPSKSRQKLMDPSTSSKCVSWFKVSHNDLELILMKPSHQW